MLDETPPSRRDASDGARLPRQRLERTALTDRLTRSRTPLTVVQAPAGYGKSVLAEEWIRREDRRATMISMGARDDPFASARTVLGTDPLLLVLDNVERLARPGEWAEVESLLGSMPDGSTLALVGRTVALRSLARRRAERGVTDLGVPDLRMDLHEVDALVRTLGFVPESDAVRHLLARTEGWAAAIVLILSSERGDDRRLDEYVQAEVLASLSESERQFLSRASILEWLSADLCDAALPSASSGRTIASLRSSAVPLFPLEGRRWRLHPIVRDVLRFGMEAAEPEAVVPVAERGSAWCERNGFLGTAISLAQSAGDIDRVAALTVRGATKGSWADTLPDIHERLRWIAHRVPLERYPFAAAVGAWVHINTGNATVAQRLAAAAARGPLEAIGPDGSPLGAWISLLRAALSRDGVEQSQTDAMWALENLAPGSSWRAPAWLIFGIGCAVSGDWAEADTALADAVAEAREDGSLLVLAMALGEQALVAIQLDRWANADALARDGIAALSERSTDSSWAAGIAHVAAAEVALQMGKIPAARAHLQHASDTLVHLTRAIPVVSVQVRLEAARAHLALGDEDAARTLLDEADDVLRAFPKMQELTGWSNEIRTHLHRRADGPVRLTNAELRLLPLLATHMTFQAIADELFLSLHTIKAEAISIYRKLGQTSRGATIARAREIGLIRP